jgi:hypothetical protein
MSSPASRTATRVSEPDPFGDVTLVPRQMSGQSEADLARAMAETLIDAEPGSQSEALRILRLIFPHSPLTVRVTALGALMRTAPHMPR